MRNCVPAPLVSITSLLRLCGASFYSMSSTICYFRHRSNGKRKSCASSTSFSFTYCRRMRCLRHPFRFVKHLSLLSFVMEKVPGVGLHPSMIVDQVKQNHVSIPSRHVLFLSPRTGGWTFRPTTHALAHVAGIYKYNFILLIHDTTLDVGESAVEEEVHETLLQYELHWCHRLTGAGPSDALNVTREMAMPSLMIRSMWSSSVLADGRNDFMEVGCRLHPGAVAFLTRLCTERELDRHLLDCFVQGMSRAPLGTVPLNPTDTLLRLRDEDYREMERILRSITAWGWEYVITQHRGEPCRPPPRLANIQSE